MSIREAGGELKMANWSGVPGLGRRVLVTSESPKRPRSVEFVQVGPGRRREFCHSAAPSSPFSRCFNRDGEKVSAK